MTLESPSLGPLLSHHSLTAKLPYISLRKSLQLVVDISDDAEEPEDISYVYSGYAPVSVRLVQCVVQKARLSGPISKNFKNAAARAEERDATSTLGRSLGWKGFEETLTNLSGESFDVENKQSESESALARSCKSFR